MKRRAELKYEIIISSTKGKHLVTKDISTTEHVTAIEQIWNDCYSKQLPATTFKDKQRMAKREKLVAEIKTITTKYDFEKKETDYVDIMQVIAPQNKKVVDMKPEEWLPMLQNKNIRVTATAILLRCKELGYVCPSNEVIQYLRSAFRKYNHQDFEVWYGNADHWRNIIRQIYQLLYKLKVLMYQNEEMIGDLVST